MTSSCDIGNPIYDKEPKPVEGTDFIEVPVYDEGGTEVMKEKIYFTYEQYGNEMVVRLLFYLSHEDDVHMVLKDNYRNFNITYK